MEDKKPSAILDWLERFGISIEQLEAHDHPTYTRPILALIKQSRELERQHDLPWDYKTLAQLGAESFAIQGAHWAIKSAGPNLFQLNDFPLVDAAEQYSQCVTGYLSYVGEGMPLYVREPNGSFRHAQDTDEPYLFVRLLLKHGGWSDISFVEAPEWAKTLWVRHRDLEANWMIYGDASPRGEEKYRRTQVLRKNAYRAFLAGVLVDTEEQDFAKRAHPEPIHSAPASRDGLPTKLEAAIAAYEAVKGNLELRRGRSTKAALTLWLEQNRPQLSNQAREEVAKVANWNPEGGAPRTPE